jgi:arylsulfatase A-like enzyme
VDVFPTILSWVDIPLPEGLDGRPLQQGLEGEPRVILSETWRFNRELSIYMDKIAGISSSRKMTWDLMDETRKLQRIDDSGVTEPEDLIDRQPDPRLEAVINGYLEQNRRVKVVN